MISLVMRWLTLRKLPEDEDAVDHGELTQEQMEAAPTPDLEPEGQEEDD